MMRAYPLLLGALLVLSGCATLFSGTDEEITFNSEPPGATVIVDGIAVGTTPTTVEVDRPGLEDMDVTVQIEGYDSRTFELDKEFNTTSILNVFFWPGFVIDALTGALFKYDKSTYRVDFEEGTVSLRLEDLPRGVQGQYLLPDLDKPIAIVDGETKLTLLFN